MNGTEIILIGFASVAGGVIGGKLVYRISAVTLRRIIVALIYMVHR